MAAEAVAGAGPDSNPLRWRQLGLIALVEILVMGLWFSASTVVPALRDDWGVSNQAASWLTTSVQIGFVCGAVCAAALNLADVLSIRVLIAGSALLGAAANAAFALFADGLATAIPLRMLTGVALAGVYPPGMKLIATWFRARRGLAIGVLVGSLSLGSGSPHLINGVTTFSWQGVLAVSSVLACLGALVVVAFVREGPLRTATPPIFPGYVVTVFRDRAQRLANFGYFGHMWELYAFWTWLPAYVTAAYAAWRTGADTRAAVGLTVFGAIALAGCAGCLIGGQMSDRYGRAELTIGAMAVSGASCLLSAAVFGLHPAVVVLLLAVWGAAVIADSAQFSTCLTELADQRYVGTALTVQTAIGFMITVASIRLLPVFEGVVGWRFAFAGLAIGPALGVVSMARLRASGTLRGEQLDLGNRLGKTDDRMDRRSVYRNKERTI